MILSEERQTHLAHVIIDGIWNDDLVEYSDEDQAIKTGKRAIVRFVQEAEQLDEKVRNKISSLKRNVMEGTPEWEVMYSKYFDEEMLRSGNS